MFIRYICYWNLQFLYYVFILILRYSSLRWLFISSKPFIFLAPKEFKIIWPVISFGFERTWWMLFQIRVVRTKFDIYVFYYVLVVKAKRPPSYQGDLSRYWQYPLYPLIVFLLTNWFIFQPCLALVKDVPNENASSALNVIYLF